MNKQELKNQMGESTDRNDHNNTVLLFAEYVSDEKAITSMQRITSQQEQLGYMPPDLMDEKNAVVDDLRAKHPGLSIEVGL